MICTHCKETQATIGGLCTGCHLGVTDTPITREAELVEQRTALLARVAELEAWQREAAAQMRRDECCTGDGRCPDTTCHAGRCEHYTLLASAGEVQS